MYKIQFIFNNNTFMNNRLTECNILQKVFYNLLGILS